MNCDFTKELTEAYLEGELCAFVVAFYAQCFLFKKQEVNTATVLMTYRLLVEDVHGSLADSPTLSMRVLSTCKGHDMTNHPIWNKKKAEQAQNTFQETLAVDNPILKVYDILHAEYQSAALEAHKSIRRYFAYNFENLKADYEKGNTASFVTNFYVTCLLNKELNRENVISAFKDVTTELGVTELMRNQPIWNKERVRKALRYYKGKETPVAKVFRILFAEYTDQENAREKAHETFMRHFNEEEEEEEPKKRMKYIVTFV